MNKKRLAARYELERTFLGKESTTEFVERIIRIHIESTPEIQESMTVFCGGMRET